MKLMSQDYSKASAHWYAAEDEAPAPARHEGPAGLTLSHREPRVLRRVGMSSKERQHTRS